LNKLFNGVVETTEVDTYLPQELPDVPATELPDEAPGAESLSRISAADIAVIVNP
jgi:hypothetical protein